MLGRWRASVIAVAALSLAAAGGRGQEEAGGTATVHLGDGSSIPLQGWRLSYDYQSWPKGGTPLAGASAQRQLRTLIVGKRSVALGPGTSFELVRKEGRVRELVVTSDGRQVRLKAEPPSRELLVPNGDGSLVVMAQSADLVGATITGTRRSFCLIAFSTLVECPTDPAQQVVRVEVAAAAP